MTYAIFDRNGKFLWFVSPFNHYKYAQEAELEEEDFLEYILKIRK